MTEEPYRWLEAVGNRREYVREQLKGGSPVFAVSLVEGILLLGVGSGQSKVFELFDRHAMAGLGHPADLEKIRQGAIDAAHTEAFTRAPEDVSLRRLVSFGLSGTLKTSFEQIFSAPFLLELVLTEVGAAPEQDLQIRLHYDGSFNSQLGGVTVVASQAEPEKAAQQWLNRSITEKTSRAEAADLLLQAWWGLLNNQSFDSFNGTPPGSEKWREQLKEKDRGVEMGWLARKSSHAARYEPLTLSQLGL